jgi:hypothetical protein
VKKDNLGGGGAMQINELIIGTSNINNNNNNNINTNNNNNFIHN